MFLLCKWYFYLPGAPPTTSIAGLLPSIKFASINNPFIHLGEERYYEGNVSCPRTQIMLCPQGSI